MKPTIILANANQTISFAPKTDKVEVTYRQRGWKWGQRVTMTTEQARAKYRELVASGYNRW